MASHLHYYNNNQYTDLIAYDNYERRIIYTHKRMSLSTTPSTFALDEDNETTRGISRITSLRAHQQLFENITAKMFVQVGNGSVWFYIAYGLPVQRRDAVNIITSSNPIYFDGSSSVMLRCWVVYDNPLGKPLSPSAPKMDISFERIYRV